MTTFVLVHGGWHGEWCWRLVAPHLRQAGHEVHTPTLTGTGDRAHLATTTTGLATHVEDVLAVLDLDDLRDVVLVGHSAAGAVITGVAQRRAERLRELVFLDAFVPRPGQSVADVTPARKPFTSGLDEIGRLVLDLEAALDVWGVPDPADRSWMRQRLRPHPAQALTDPLPADPLPALPRRYIHCTVKPRGDTFAEFAAAARTDPAWRFDELDAGHAAMLTAPKELAEQLLRS